jgi:hypothetical protein
MKKSFLAATGQSGFVYATVAGVIAAGWWVRTATRRSLATLSLWEFVASLVLGFGSFAALMLFVKCPRCSTRLFWRAASKSDVSGWLIGPLLATECPVCHYVPDGDAHT